MYSKQFHMVPGSPVFPEPPAQADLPAHAGEYDCLRDVQAAVLYARAYERADALMNYLHRKMVKGTGCKLLGRKDVDTPNYPVKDLRMLHEKAARKYDGDVSRITDPLRFRITFQTYNQYDRLSNKFLPANNANVLEYEPGIRFDLGKGGFAVDQIVMADLESGLRFEVQIMHEAHHQKNRETHEAYEIERASEHRAMELGTHWRCAANAARRRHSLNKAANEQANVADMRYTATFGLSQDNAPFAAIWPCAYDDPLMIGPKYILVPSLANQALIHDVQLKNTLNKVLAEDNVGTFAELRDVWSFIRASQQHVRKNKPQPGRCTPRDKPELS